MSVVALVKPEPNQDLIEELEKMLSEARRGEFIGFAGVKLRPENMFGVFRVGDCSDLELLGAMQFVVHDIIQNNHCK